MLFSVIIGVRKVRNGRFRVVLGREVVAIFFVSVFLSTVVVVVVAGVVLLLLRRVRGQIVGVAIPISGGTVARGFLVAPRPFFAAWSLGEV